MSLVVEALGKRYGEVIALEGVSLSAPRGARTAIIGPSGSGKTTFLRLVAGFDAPDAGRVSLGGAVLADPATFVPAHRRRVGYVAQDGALFPHLTVAGNVGFGLDDKSSTRAGRIAELLDLVELDRTLTRRFPHELSGGQQQRVALARALARRPALMLLDEPFSALDTGLRESVRETVARVLREAGITACLVTHDQTEALTFADELAVLREGRLAQAGAPRDLYWRPADPQTALFLGEAHLFDVRIGEGFVDGALGRLPAVTKGRRGAGRAMLRLEQIGLAAGPLAGAARARVADVAFAGSVCHVALILTDGRRIAARAASLEPPEAGAEVSLAIAGAAHLFPA